MKHGIGLFYAPNTSLCGAIVLPPVSAPEDFQSLRIHPEKEIVFLAVVPLYAEEMNLKLRSGSNELLSRFGKAEISDVVDLLRPNLAVRKKWFGFM